MSGSWARASVSRTRASLCLPNTVSQNRDTAGSPLRSPVDFSGRDVNEPSYRISMRTNQERLTRAAPQPHPGPNKEPLSATLLWERETESQRERAAYTHTHAAAAKAVFTAGLVERSISKVICASFNRLRHLNQRLDDDKKKDVTNAWKKSFLQKRSHPETHPGIAGLALNKLNKCRCLVPP